MTNDPSMTGWGYVILSWEGKILKAGVIKTEPQHKKKKIRVGEDTARRISELNSVLQSEIKFHNVNYLLSELPHGSQSAVSAKMIGIVTAIMQTISDWNQIGLEWYSEGDVKKYLFNRQSVAKQEMIDKIDSIMDVQWTKVKWRDEAVADALGVYQTALKQSATLKLLNTL